MTDVLARFPDAKKSGSGWIARCPNHEDSTASLAITERDDGGWLLHCHAGCDTAAVLDRVGLVMVDLMPPNPARFVRRRISDTYTYTDEEGVELFQCVRLTPKRFFQRRPDGKGGYINNLDGVRLVLFDLSRLKGCETVIVCEGEKDVRALQKVGLMATTSPMGAGKWRDDYATWLQAAGVRHVIALADNDEAGREHAEQIASSCRAVGIIAKTINLPDLPPKGDVSDYLGAHSADELRAIIAEALTPATSAAAPLPLSRILADVERLVRGFVILTSEQALAVALWTAHTYAIGAFDCVPYLSVTSVTKRCGKTRLFEVLEQVVARPWMTARTTAAALVRKVDGEAPTLLFDETDATFKGNPELSQTLRGILNSGFRRSGRVTLCVGQGASLTTRDFSTFGAKAFALIGDLPDTVADRSIPIRLERKTGAERVERFRERDVRDAMEPIRAALTSWGAQAETPLRAARPELPEALNDRAQDVWECLLAIADAAGDGFPERARRSAVTLTGEVHEDDVALDLLRDIREVFGETTTFVSTTAMVQKLGGLEDRPWKTWSKGNLITGHALARVLKPFGIVPVQNTERTARGYLRDRLNIVWLRYLPLEASEASDGPQNRREGPFSDRPSPSAADASPSGETPATAGLADTSDTLEARREAPAPASDRPGRTQDARRTRRPGRTS